MKTLRLLLASLLLLPALHAQTIPAPPKSAREVSPFADTNDPALLKAQIIMLQNDAASLRKVLSQLSEYQQAEQDDKAANEKLSRLNTLIAAEDKAKAEEAAKKADKPKVVDKAKVADDAKDKK